jgi:hypothetical protein
MTPLSQPYLHVVYCDDVRQEINGKMMHLGVYGNELVADAFPLLMAKLAVVATYAYPNGHLTGDNPFSVQLMSLMLDDELLLEVAPTPQPAGNPGPTSGGRGIMMTLMLAMAPFHLTRPGKLRLQVSCSDGSLVYGNGLVCRLNTPAEKAQPPAPVLGLDLAAPAG